MKKWEKFEIEATEYLNANFSEYADFIHEGKSNSTIADIRVIKKNGNTFFIEAKYCPAQSGQFVLIPNDNFKKFIYSTANINHINPYAQEITNFINKNFEKFKNAGTTGVEILCNKSIFTNWILTTYKSKNIKFIISNNFIIIPINKFDEYFHVTAKFRIKKSGSSAVGIKNIPKLIEFLTNEYLKITNIRVQEPKLFITSKYNLNNKRFEFENNEYMLSLRGNEFELRKLSKTFNANVIFSIRLLTNINGLTYKEFIRELL